MIMTKEEILTMVAIKFCSRCTHNYCLTQTIEDCVHNKCVYKETYNELKKHLEKAEKEVNK